MNIEELRNKQLKDFDTNVHWERLIDLVVFNYVESGIGGLKIPVESMIRIYFLQIRYELSAVEVTTALSRIDVLKEFTLIDTNTDVLPSAEYVSDFNALVKSRKLETKFLDEFNILVKQT